MKKRVVVISIIIAVAAGIAGSRLILPTKPVDVLEGYEPPAEEIASPELLTQDLPAGFEAGVPATIETTYPDGTAVTEKLVMYTRGLESTAVVRVVDVCGEKLIENTPNIEEYEFNKVEFSGNTVIKFTGENICGYIWNYGKYSIMIFSFSINGKVPQYLDDFVKLYIDKYYSNL